MSNNIIKEKPKMESAGGSFRHEANIRLSEMKFRLPETTEEKAAAIVQAMANGTLTGV